MDKQDLRYAVVAFTSSQCEQAEYKFPVNPERKKHLGRFLLKKMASLKKSKNIVDADCEELEELEKKGEELGAGLEGVVFKACAEVKVEEGKCEMPVAVKRAYYFYAPNDNAIFDAKIGSAVTHDILDKGVSINFVRQLSWKKCLFSKPREISPDMPKALGEVYQVSQLMDMNLDDYIGKNKLSEHDWFNVIFQVIHAILTLENHDIIDFDFHDGNVLVKILGKKDEGTLLYFFKDKRLKLKGVKATMHVTDFGFTRSDKYSTYVVSHPEEGLYDQKASPYNRKGREAPLLKFYTLLEFKLTPEVTETMGRMKDFLNVDKYPAFVPWINEKLGDIPELYPENQLEKLIKTFPEYVVEESGGKTDVKQTRFTGSISRESKFSRGVKSPRVVRKDEKGKGPPTPRKGGGCPPGTEEFFHRGQILCATRLDPQQKLLTCNGITLPAEACMEIGGVRKHFTSDWETYAISREKYWTRQELVDAAVAVDLPNSFLYLEKYNFEEAMKGLRQFLGNYVVEGEKPKPKEEKKKPEIPGCRPYVEIRYVNNAWGFSHSGMIIDVQGQLFKYDFSARNGKERAEESKGWDRDARLRNASFQRRLSPGEFRELIEAVELATQEGFIGKWKKDGYANDAGVTTYSVYVMVSKGEVREFKVAEFGDTAGHVETEASQILVQKMASLAKERTSVPGTGKTEVGVTSTSATSVPVSLKSQALGKTRSPKSKGKSPRKR